ncbi:MAG: hypothetical protein ABSD77_08900 [Verrucomicrobiota bacterium]|jgi:hypothetical protein
MAEIPPNIPSASTGIVLPPKKETGKVQPKKETVRISLPSKPSTAPTIKLPTLPPGGPTGAPSAMPSAAAHAQAASPRATAAPATPPRSAPAVRQTARAAAPTINPLDQILVIAAAVTGLFAIVTTVWMMLILSGAISQ